MIKAFLAFVLIGFIAAKKCPNVKVMSDFNLSKALGKWYEYQYSDNELGGKCVTLTFCDNKNGTMSAFRNQVSTATFTHSTYRGNITQDKSDKSKVIISFSVFDAKEEFTVLDTDYVTFAAIWHCEKGIQNVWLLTKERSPKESVLEKAYAVFEKNKIKRSALKILDNQEDYCCKT